jgi:hypothetical protein
MIFPTEGCWEITSKVGDTTLTDRSVREIHLSGKATIRQLASISFVDE